MNATSGRAPPYVPSYSARFQNATRAITKTKSSPLTPCEYISLSRTSEMIYLNGPSSGGRVMSETAVEPIVALSTADSIVLPSLDFQEQLPSEYTTTSNRREPISVFVPSIWCKDFDTVVPTKTTPDQYSSTGAIFDLTRCDFGSYYTVFSSLCGSLSGAYVCTTDHDDCTTTSRLIEKATNYTSRSPSTETQETRTSAVLSPENITEQINASTSKPRDQGHFPAPSTNASFMAVTQQTVDRSPHGSIDGSTTRPYDTVPSVMDAPSASITPQTPTPSSWPWSRTGLSYRNSWTQTAINGSVSALTTPTSAPPTFASTGQMVASRFAWVLMCLLAIAMIHI